MSLQYKLLLILATTFFFVLNYRERIVEPIHTMAIWNKCFLGNFLFRFIIIWFYARVNGFSVFLHPFDIHFHVSIMPFPSPLRLFQMKNDPSICWVKNRWNDFGVFFSRRWTNWVISWEITSELGENFKQTSPYSVKVSNSVDDFIPYFPIFLIQFSFLFFCLHLKSWCKFINDFVVFSCIHFSFVALGWFVKHEWKLWDKKLMENYKKN